MSDTSTENSVNKANPWSAYFRFAVILIVTVVLALNTPVFGHGRYIFDNDGMKNFASMLLSLLILAIGIPLSLVPFVTKKGQRVEPQVQERGLPSVQPRVLGLSPSALMLISAGLGFLGLTYLYETIGWVALGGSSVSGLVGLVLDSLYPKA